MPPDVSVQWLALWSPVQEVSESILGSEADSFD
jgi:hypothetical protein